MQQKTQKWNGGRNTLFSLPYILKKKVVPEQIIKSIITPHNLSYIAIIIKKKKKVKRNQAKKTTPDLFQSSLKMGRRENEDPTLTILFEVLV